MNDWGRATYGEPCRECGYTWATSLDDAVAIMEAVPPTDEAALEGASGTEQHPDRSWSVGAYVCHVANNLRIWAERLAGVAAGAPPDVALYDENELAIARRYEEIPLQGALWTLRRAVDNWLAAIEEARVAGVVLRHPVRGALSLAEVAGANAHDAVHHAWDLDKTLRR